MIKYQNLPAILPCPFCGKPGELHVDEITERIGKRNVFTVACGFSWGSDAVPLCYGQLTLDKYGDFSFYWGTAEEAIEVWNTRAV